MADNGLHWFDIFIIALYLLASFGVGVWVSLTMGFNCFKWTKSMGCLRKKKNLISN